MSPARKTTRRKKKPAALPPKSATPVELVAGDRSQRLGNKHLCYSCGARFYDMNRPEPVCPRCEANQLEKPKEVVEKPAPAGTPKPRPRAKELAYLDDEDETEAPAEGEADAATSPAEGESALFDDQTASTEEED